MVPLIEQGYSPSTFYSTDYCYYYHHHPIMWCCVQSVTVSDSAANCTAHSCKYQKVLLCS